MHLSYLLLLKFLLISFVITPDVNLEQQQRRTERLFNELKLVKGILPAEKPFVQVVRKLPKTQFKLAMADPSEGMIYVEEKTYRLCMSMKEDSINALAFILSHELSHFTRRHNERHRFIDTLQQDVTRNQEVREVIRNTRRSDPNNQTSRLDETGRTDLQKLYEEFDALSRKYRIRKNEAEADLDAGFTSYLAGYRCLKAGPAFLEKAYKSFRIPAKAGDYASLEDRKEIVRNASLRLDTLIHIFELGNYLSIAGEYQAAADCYSYVAESYSSKELYNNLGVLCLKELSKGLCIPQFKYALPLTMDLGDGGGSRNADLEARRLENMKLYKEQVALIQKAIAYFDRASVVDPDYYVPELNKSIAYVLMNTVKDTFVNLNYDFVDFYGDEVSLAKSSAVLAKQRAETSSLTTDKQKSDIFNQLAVISHMLADFEKAEILIETALRFNPNNAFAKANKSKFLSDMSGIEKIYRAQYFEPSNDFDTKESVLGDSDLDILNSQTFEWNLRETIGEQMAANEQTPSQTEVCVFEQEDFKYYRLWNRKAGKVLSQSDFFLTKPSYTHSPSLDVTRGVDQDDVVFEYGEEPAITNTRSGDIYKYSFSSELNKRQDGVMFMFDPSNALSEWIVYRIKKP